MRSTWCVSLMLAVFGWASLGHLASAAAEPETLIYLKPGNALRGDYAVKLLELALARSGRDYVLQPTEAGMTQARAARELELGNIDLIWAGTSAEYEQRFRPVRIPVLRGLDGYRICIIGRDRQAAFSAVTSLDDLRGLSIGQGAGWSDVTILEAAGFDVVLAPYESLFAMVERERFDCFLRGVHEAPREVAEHQAEHPGIALESEVLLVYPFTSFFFVNRDDAALAEALETGLEAAYDDGSFMALFNAHPAITAIFAEAHMEGRRRFDIPNPLLTEATRNIPDRYWHGR
jgi:ABC-type amino acid transport substrate-binding protein